jgi:sirohydrochlorin ferrochelatase
VIKATIRTNNKRKGIVLVGHGAAAKDCPRELVMRLKALEAQRHRSGGGPTPEEIDLDRRVRTWPRTPENDPYKAGLESLADQMRTALNGTVLAVAYNEFCAPSLEEAVGDLIARGIQAVTVVPSMTTPGGVHSEVEIPAILNKLRIRYPEVIIQYAWPFDLNQVARMITDHLSRG